MALGVNPCYTVTTHCMPRIAVALGVLTLAIPHCMPRIAYHNYTLYASYRCCPWSVNPCYTVTHTVCLVSLLPLELTLAIRNYTLYASYRCCPWSVNPCYTVTTHCMPRIAVALGALTLAIP